MAPLIPLIYLSARRPTELVRSVVTIAHTSRIVLEIAVNIVLRTFPQTYERVTKQTDIVRLVVTRAIMVYNVTNNVTAIV